MEAEEGGQPPKPEAKIIAIRATSVVPCQTALIDERSRLSKDLPDHRDSQRSRNLVSEPHFLAVQITDRHNLEEHPLARLSERPQRPPRGASRASCDRSREVRAGPSSSQAVGQRSSRANAG